MKLRQVWDTAFAMSMLVLGLIAFGLVSRVAVWLFCLGYGC